MHAPSDVEVDTLELQFQLFSVKHRFEFSDFVDIVPEQLIYCYLSDHRVALQSVCTHLFSDVEKHVTR
jgi:hypothetical protein